MKALKRIWLTIRAPAAALAAGAAASYLGALFLGAPWFVFLDSLLSIPFIAIGAALLFINWSDWPTIGRTERLAWNVALPMSLFPLIVDFYFLAISFDGGYRARFSVLTYAGCLGVLCAGVRLSFLSRPGRAPRPEAPAGRDSFATFEADFEGRCSPAVARIGGRWMREAERVTALEARLPSFEADHRARLEQMEIMRRAEDVGSLRWARVQLAEARLKEPIARTEGQERNALLASGLTRFGIIFVLLFLATALLNLYRYAIRLSAFYRSRAYMLVLTDGDLDQLKRTVTALAPDNVPLEKEVKAPIDEATKIISAMKNVK